TFENFTTTDDHLMHITGIAKDQFGKKYYKVKNSWGTERNNLGGYLYASENYFRGKTVSILINKNAIPPAIRKKLGL
ncbi:MAG: aminopeptidase, partial [Bacteroidales bacterium]|nr:aminopeptidase [Bacteroidales bacterium]